MVMPDGGQTLDVGIRRNEKGWPAALFRTSDGGSGQAACLVDAEP
jgi:hypothetical protein